MAHDIQIAPYYHVTVEDHAADGAKLLALVAEAGVNLLAYKALTLKSKRALFTLFPDDSLKMAEGMKNAGLELDGPHPALIIKGYEDESGALADIYRKLSQAGITLIESSGIANIRESYGVVLYLNQQDCEKAAAVLKI